MSIESKILPARQTQTYSKLPLKGLLNLFVIYVVWGSTYLALRVSVREGAGFPPFSMGTARFSIGGLLLLAWAYVSGRRVKLNLKEFKVILISSILLWLGGNALIMWSLQYTDSGFTSLMVGSMPIMVAIQESLINRKRPSMLLILSLLVGITGLYLLIQPRISSGTDVKAYSIIVLFVAIFSWGIGTIYMKKAPLKLSMLTVAGYQQFFSSFGFIFASFATGEPFPEPDTYSLMGWGYLTIIGTLAVVSYLTAVKLLPISILSTYAYINPALAVMLGWLVLGEQVTLAMIAGAVLILSGVAGVYKNRIMG